MHNLIDFDIFCPNDDEPCLCRSCANSQLNGGTCTHCFNCIDGERSMNICESYRRE